MGGTVTNSHSRESTSSSDASLVARYVDSTLRFTGDDFSTFPATPAASQSTQRGNQLFTRAETNWTSFEGILKNRFGLNYTQAYTLEKDPDTPFGATLPTSNLGQRLQYDWQGEVALAKDWTLIAGFEDKNDQLYTAPTFARNVNKAGYLELLTRYDDRFFLASNLRYDANDQFGGHTTFRLAPTFHVPWIETILKLWHGFQATDVEPALCRFSGLRLFWQSQFEAGGKHRI